METGPKVLYLFCFARSHLVGEIEGTGVDGRLSLWVFRTAPDLCAIVSEVPLEDFCGAEAELRMQELAWVAPRALRHEEVVEKVRRQSPVLPSRFGTLFSSSASLAEFLKLHHQTISQFLDRVADQDEWSVKGLLDRKQAGQALISESITAQQAQLAPLPPGTRYFQEQRIRAGAEKELSLWLSQTCRQIASDLREQASDFCVCPVVPCEPPESEIEVVVNWAFLLPKNSTTAFRARIDELNANHAPQGLIFELSGPWPPYRFVPPLSMGARA
jgi:hypothetical protein